MLYADCRSLTFIWLSHGIWLEDGLSMWVRNCRSLWSVMLKLLLTFPAFSNDAPPVLPFSRTKPASSASPIPTPASTSSARAPLPSYEQLFVKSSPHASPSASISASSKPSNAVIVDDLFQNPVPPPRKTSRAASVASSKVGRIRYLEGQIRF